MTTASTTVRRASTLAATFLITFIAGATAAFADAPVGDDWPAAEGRGVLGNLVVFGGGTLALFAVVALFGLLTARNNYVPPPPSRELATTPGNTPAQH
ncbi:hypothetical protein [Aeromicrobium sp. CF3.5]|uniref:hypothetical protein n=1 Tax=Aeromicrobium sp. CF3.5 TaxID=3373078 RepID=UPI003EE5B784